MEKCKEKAKKEVEFWKKEYQKAESRAEAVKNLNNDLKLLIISEEQNPIRNSEEFAQTIEDYTKSLNKLISENEVAKKNCKKR